MTSSALSSACSRLDQIAQARETALEACAGNAVTGEVLHGAAAMFALTQGNASRNNRSGRSSHGNRSSESNREASCAANSRPREGSHIRPPAAAADQPTTANIYLDLTDPQQEQEMQRLSAINRRRSRAPSAIAVAATGDSAPPSAGDDGHGDGTDGIAPPASTAASSFPKKLVMSIIASQVLSAAPTIMFAAVSPYIFGYIVGDFQTAGTVSAIATGLSMLLQVVVTPILAQLLDLYGRRPFAVIASLRSVAVVAPLVLAGFVINSAMAGQSVPDHAKDTDVKLGAYITDEDKSRFVKFLFILYWVLSLLSNAVSTSHALVAIGDVCQTQQQRCAAIGVYAGLNYVLAACAIVGAQLSLMVGGLAAVAVGLVSVAWAVMMMPETVAMHGAATSGNTADSANESTAVVPIETAADAYSSPTFATKSTPTSVTARRRSIYPEQLPPTHHAASSSSDDHIPLKSAEAALAINATVSGSSPSADACPTAQHPSVVADSTPRRIHLLVNPLKGMGLIRQSRTSVVALMVLFSCLMAEISASDTLVYYLSLTLDFTPSETSYLQMEQAGLSILFCGVLGPLVAKHVSCARICMMCSVGIVAALVTLALAGSSAVIYIVYGPCMGFASIMMPSVAAIVTRNASTPADVSLVMSTLMALVSLLQAAGSFVAAMVFKALPRDLLWITFIVAAAFTIPMFAFSVLLEWEVRKEAAAAEAGEAAAAQQQAEDQLKTPLVDAEC